ncbi:MAG: DUF4393 domain-containing protein [Telmatospirillum sp.]|nr:DUF4393 domain-containing protein [Telmatospirillum sp.]
MSGDSEKLKIDVQLPASWQAGVAKTWKAISGPASGALAVLKQRTFMWQLDNAAKILEQMRKLSEDYGVEIGPVSPKFLIPFLEKAGLEAEDAVELRDAWAHLLLNESITSDALNIAFLDVLSKLTSIEAKLIIELGARFERDLNKSIFFPMSKAVLEKMISNVYSEVLKSIENEGIQNDTFERAAQTIEGVEREMQPGESRAYTLKVTKMSLPLKREDGSIKGSLSGTTRFFNANSNSILALLRLGILEENSISSLNDGPIEIVLEWVQLTQFGVRFCNACGQIDVNLLSPTFKSGVA